MVSINRELNVDYFGIKIRKIEPVIKPVEGFKVKVSFFLGHPVLLSRPRSGSFGTMKLGRKLFWASLPSYVNVRVGI